MLAPHPFPKRFSAVEGGDRNQREYEAPGAGVFSSAASSSSSIARENELRRKAVLPEIRTINKRPVPRKACDAIAPEDEHRRHHRQGEKRKHAGKRNDPLIAPKLQLETHLKHDKWHDSRVAKQQQNDRKKVTQFLRKPLPLRRPRL